MQTYRPNLGESFEEFTVERSRTLVEQGIGQPGLPIEIVELTSWDWIVD